MGFKKSSLFSKAMREREQMTDEEPSVPLLRAAGWAGWTWTWLSVCQGKELDCNGDVHGCHWELDLIQMPKAREKQSN